MLEAVVVTVGVGAVAMMVGEAVVVGVGVTTVVESIASGPVFFGRIESRDTTPATAAAAPKRSPRNVLRLTGLLRGSGSLLERST